MTDGKHISPVGSEWSHPKYEEPLTMKSTNALIAVLAQLLLNSVACAQSCTPSAGALSDSPPTNVVINTCASVNQLAQLCDDATPIGSAPDTIFVLQIGASAAGAVNVIPDTYDAFVALLSGNCTTGATCAREIDTGGNNAPEMVSFAGLPEGAYFLLVTSLSTSWGNCGNTQVVVFPTLPVTLQNFSIN